MITEQLLRKLKNAFVKTSFESQKIENVIWQTTEGLYTEFELQYIKDYLLKDITYNAVFDYSKYLTILNNSLIVFSNDSPAIPTEFKEYLKKYNKLNYNYWLLHLSNERLAHKHNFSYYKKAKHVFRGYFDPRISLKNVTTIPIGFKSGFLNIDQVSPKVSEREYMWCFIGQLKRDRKEMYETLLPIKPQYTYTTTQFNAPEQLSVVKIINIYKHTIFVPCPMGYCNPDTFRLNEALEWGCIPIVKKFNGQDYFKNVYGNHPLIVVDSWADAEGLIKSLSADIEKLETYRQHIQTWYLNFKQNLQRNIRTILVGE